MFDLVLRVDIIFVKIRYKKYLFTFIKFHSVN